MSLTLLFHYLLLNMFRMLVHPSSRCGILMQAEALPVGYHTTPAEPHRNTNTHRTRAIQHMK